MSPLRNTLPLLLLTTAALAQSTAPSTLPSISFDAPAPPAPALSFPMDDRVGKGMPILLPVTFLGKPRTLLLDTGAGGTLLDKSFAPQLGDIVGRATVSNLGGHPMPLYRAPALDVRGTPLPTPTNQVALNDLSEFRKELRTEIDGILGYDVLKQFVVRLNFQTRTVELIDPASFKPPTPSDKCAAFPLKEDAGVPHATLPILDLKDVSFQLDTGDHDWGSITPDIEKQLGDAVFGREQGEIITAAGTAPLTALLIDKPWNLAGTHFDETHLTSGNRNVMGLALLANYIVTFDFPNSTLYLENLYAEDPTKFKALVTGLKNGRLLVTAVGARAYRLGVRVDDELIAFGGESLVGKTPEEISKIAQKHGSQTTYQFRRGDKIFEVTPPPPKK